MSEIIPLFAKPLYINQLNLDFDDTIKSYGKFIDSGTGIKTNISQRSESVKILDDEKLSFLKDVLEGELNEFLQNKLKYTNQFKITTSWITKSEKGQSSNYHCHKNSFFSGVLYLKVTPETGEISFEDFNSSAWKCNRKEYNVNNSIEIRIKPKNGMLLIFPSEVHHAILENKSDTIRYTLAFNIIPVGEFGEQDSTLVL